MIFLLDSLRRAFNAYTRHPFIFVWGSLVYLLMLLVFALATFGFFVLFFMAASLLGVTVDFGQLPTQVAAAVIAVVFMYFNGGLNAGLAMTYHKALTKNKTSLAEFYAFAMHKAPEMFGILLVREFLTLLLVGPAVAVYVFFLQGVEFADYLLYTYALGWVFVLHCLFTPAFIAAGAFGKNMFAAMRHAFYFMKAKHVNYIGLFILFAFVWLMNFIPLVQFATLFFAYPLVYAALIQMMESSEPNQEE